MTRSGTRTPMWVLNIAGTGSFLGGFDFYEKPIAYARLIRDLPINISAYTGDYGSGQSKTCTVADADPLKKRGCEGRLTYSISMRDLGAIIDFFRWTSRTPFLKLAFAPSSVTSAGSTTTRCIDPATRSRM